MKKDGLDNERVTSNYYKWPQLAANDCKLTQMVASDREWP